MRGCAASWCATEASRRRSSRRWSRSRVSPNRLVAVSNAGCDRDSLEQRIVDAIDGAPAVVFVDMPSGSCLFAALHRLRDEPNVKVVTGVNLAMLIDFVFHADDGPAEAAARAVVTGERAIRIP